MIDTLTGEYTLTRVDILHDAGKSLNPAIDLGQVEGGFIQGMGWLTSEELCVGRQGPAAHPCAQHLQDPDLLRPAGGFPHGSCWRRAEPRGDHPSLQGGGRAAADAGDLGVPRASPTPSPASADYRVLPQLDAPATPERVLFAVEELQARHGGGGMSWLRRRAAICIAAGEPAVLVTVAEAKGPRRASPAPRCWCVTRDIVGSVGGGQLELLAIDAARRHDGGRRAPAGPDALFARPAISANAAAARCGCCWSRSSQIDRRWLTHGRRMPTVAKPRLLVTGGRRR